MRSVSLGLSALVVSFGVAVSHSGSAAPMGLDTTRTPDNMSVANTSMMVARNASAAPMRLVYGDFDYSRQNLEQWVSPPVPSHYDGGPVNLTALDTRAKGRHDDFYLRAYPQHADRLTGNRINQLVITGNYIRSGTSVAFTTETLPDGHSRCASEQLEGRRGQGNVIASEALGWLPNGTTQIAHMTGFNYAAASAPVRHNNIMVGDVWNGSQFTRTVNYYESDDGNAQIKYIGPIWVSNQLMGPNGSTCIQQVRPQHACTKIDLYRNGTFRAVIRNDAIEACAEEPIKTPIAGGSKGGHGLDWLSELWGRRGGGLFGGGFSTFAGGGLGLDLWSTVPVRPRTESAPEPMSLVLLATGLAGLGAFSRRGVRKAAASATAPDAP